MEESQHRHSISDKAWAIFELMLPGQRGQWGGIAEDNRRFINGVFWILRTGAPWRDLPPDYGKWGSVHQRFHRWRDKGIWERILEASMDSQNAHNRAKSDDANALKYNMFPQKVFVDASHDSMGALKIAPNAAIDLQTEPGLTGGRAAASVLESTFNYDSRLQHIWSCCGRTCTAC